MFPLQQRAWVQLVCPKLEDATFSARRSCGEERKSLAELLTTRRQIGYQLVVRVDVLQSGCGHMICVNNGEHKDLPTQTNTHLRAPDLLSCLVVSSIVLVLQDVDCGCRGLITPILSSQEAWTYRTHPARRRRTPSCPSASHATQGQP